MNRRPAASYEAIRLHSHSENAWAVIEMPSGAIALDAEKCLLMGMLKQDAVDLAKTLMSIMTSATQRDPTSNSALRPR